MMQEELKLPSPPTSTVVDDSIRLQEATRANQQDQVPHATSTEVPYGNDLSCSKEKRGHLFFGCMCDMRRAVIAVDVISIVLAVIEVCVAITALALFDEISQTTNDDVFSGWVKTNKHASEALLGFVIGFGFVAILFYSLGIYGAANFNQCMVCAALVYHCIAVFANLVSLNIPGILLSGLFVYPHVMLFREIRLGVMTEETYVRERKTCCGPY
ncbi:expressed unknown protein [Seminavis robusta]|uniref:Uncharacterized protein n=1 Tax=Seminavis robusta TaxID=568900 RepID=A0A9N8DYE7_9STRA|nr:expressed unknown protein [Seminavis robusta]|eukprot:Sro474_g150230.1 n/a (214) ;mRNA; f:26338-26979